jgi:hypothetical protein
MTTSCTSALPARRELQPAAAHGRAAADRPDRLRRRTGLRRGRHRRPRDAPTGRATGESARAAAGARRRLCRSVPRQRRSRHRGVSGTGGTVPSASRCDREPPVSGRVRPAGFPLISPLDPDQTRRMRRTADPVRRKRHQTGPGSAQERAEPPLREVMQFFTHRAHAASIRAPALAGEVTIAVRTS